MVTSKGSILFRHFPDDEKSNYACNNATVKTDCRTRLAGKR